MSAARCRPIARHCVRAVFEQGVEQGIDAAQEPGTIRGDYGIDIGRNLVHGSDSVESANREIALWFADSELNAWGRSGTPLL